jgi:hypothetical protein
MPLDLNVGVWKIEIVLLLGDSSSSRPIAFALSNSAR